MASGAENPYKNLPKESYWSEAVAKRGERPYENLWASKWKLSDDMAFTTYGSCFAQHISRALIANKLKWVNAEPAPRLAPDELKRKFNYEIYSSRTGNIYTAAQLRLWTELALGKKTVDDCELWVAEDGRVYDMLRPRIEPNGFASLEEASLSLQSTIYRFARSVRSANVFIFTMGLTEGWENAETGMIYAMCPGTAAGAFDEAVHVFKNYGFSEIETDMEIAIQNLRQLNPKLRILITVSPVPLVATASGKHVLSATTYSKSVLRAVAGLLESRFEYLDYFPSYEIITTSASHGRFFQDNLREVRPEGVAFVMGHFLKGLKLEKIPKRRRAKRSQEDEDNINEAKLVAQQEAEDLVCEEMILESQNAANS